MKWLVVKKQREQGCDYGIGCGMRYDVAEAQTIEEVTEREVYPDGDEWCALAGDEPLQEILIVPMEHVVTVDVRGLLEQHLCREEAKQGVAREAAGIEIKHLQAEIERLQAKYPS